jgi:hypothetical protein
MGGTGLFSTDLAPLVPGLQIAHKGETIMTVAIIGAGSVGSALASRLAAANLPAHFGARDPVRAGTSTAVPVLGIAEAAAPADILLLAVPAGVAVDAARAAGDLRGKILVDCTNPLRWDGGPVWTPPAAGSVAAALADALPGVRVVKGFNHFGAEIQAHPDLPGGPVDAFFAGNDDVAKTEVMALAAAMGFRPHDAGPLRNAALLESMAVLWIHMATIGGVGREFAFRIEATGR